MKYHKVPVFAEDLDESWKARRETFMRFVRFVLASYVAGILTIKGLTLAGVAASEQLGLAH